ELRRAETIQKELMADNLYEDAVVRLAYEQLPMADVTGDFVTYAPLSSLSLGFFLGDVCGHGVSAALYTILLKHVTQGLCHHHGRSPKEFLSRLNKQLIRLMPSSFITGVCGLVEVDDKTGVGKLVLAGAAHPSAILMPANGGPTRELELVSNA